MYIYSGVYEYMTNVFVLSIIHYSSYFSNEIKLLENCERTAVVFCERISYFYFHQRSNYALSATNFAFETQVVNHFFYMPENYEKLMIMKILWSNRLSNADMLILTQQQSIPTKIRYKYSNGLDTPCLNLTIKFSTISAYEKNSRHFLR